MIANFESGEFGRLACRLEHGDARAVVTASNVEEALAEMRAAVESVQANGLGECFWKEGGGEYRWVFRRDGESVRVAVLWSAGVMTGWEHVFWAECPVSEVAQLIATN